MNLGLKKTFSLEKIPFFIIITVLFLLPFFFVPSPFLSFQFSKNLLISVGVILSFSVFLICTLKDGKFDFPGNLLFASIFSIPAVLLLCSLFSASIRTSLFGYGFEIGTFSFVLILTILLFLVSVFFRSKEKIFYSYLAIFLSFFVLAIFHLLRFVFGPDFLSFGLFTDAISNTVGKWNDLGIFFGFITLLSLVTFEMASLSKLFKILLYIAFIVSLLFLCVINFSFVWIVLGLFSLVFFVYFLSFDSEEKGAQIKDLENTQPIIKPLKKRMSYHSLVVLLISCIFFFAGSNLGNLIYPFFGISNIEVRPSTSSTVSITWNTFKHDPIFGAGPNRFSSEWLKFKPEGINYTDYWSSDFNYGIGLVPTFFVTSGILGFLSWIVFFVLFLYSGFKALFTKINDKFSRYLLFSSFLVSVYLWIMCVIYVPSATIVILTYFFTGLFIASLFNEGFLKVKQISFFKYPRTSFVFVVSLVAILLVGIAFGYYIIERTVSSVYFQKSLYSFNSKGDFELAKSQLEKSIEMSPSDIYYRSLSELYLVKLNYVLPKYLNDQKNFEKDFKESLAGAVESGKQAVAFDDTNYQNFLTLGRVYETVVPLEGAYDQAKINFDKALSFSPQNPAILLEMSKLEIANNNLQKAKEFALKALQMKNNYTDAAFFLAQIEVALGNIKGAISSVEAASLMSPNDPGIFFQLGILKYNNKDYTGASMAFERAVVLVPDYSNARYFLGLSYEKMKRISDAIRQFEEVARTNPDNQEVAQILKNLKAGKSSFANTTDNKPEKRSSLPVKK